jgi:hypothetical protein
MNIAPPPLPSVAPIRLSYHWFPETAFASEADYGAATRLIKSKVADFRELP